MKKKSFKINAKPDLLMKSFHKQIRNPTYSFSCILMTVKEPCSIQMYLYLSEFMRRRERHWKYQILNMTFNPFTETVMLYVKLLR